MKALNADEHIIDCGILFVDNQIIEPPYVMHIMNDTIHINGIAIGDDLRNYYPHPPSNEQPFRRIGLLPVANDLMHCLQEEGLLIVLDQNHFVAFARFDADTLSYELMTKPSISAQSLAETIPALEDFTPSQMEKLMRFFKPNRKLVERLKQRQEDLGALIPHKGKRESAVSQPLIYFATVGGMVLVVVVFGGLLTRCPQKHKNWREVDTSDSTRAMFLRCVLWIVVLSLFDLGFTILAQYTGSFTETNPIAARFVHSPLALALFKGVMTSIGLIILLTLRRYHGAQLACWWLCLICTTLTFRWVVYSSMFMA